MESERLIPTNTSSSNATGSSYTRGSQQLQRPFEVGNYDTYASSVHSISIAAQKNSSSTLQANFASRRRKSRGASGFGDAESDKLSNWQTSFHLISFMAGSGLLYLPLALVETEWYGVLLLVAAAIVSAYTSRLLVEALDVVRWSNGSPVSYSDLGAECYGQVGRLFTSLMVNGCFLISCMGYLGLAASCVAGVTGLHKGTVFVLLGICVWFQVLVKSLKALAIFSAINVGLSFWIEAVIFGDAMYPLKQLSLQNSTFVLDTPDLSASPVYIKSAYSFMLLISGFFGHAILPTLYNHMDSPRKCSTIVAKSQFGTMLTLYLPTSIITYAVYGETMQAPLFFNMRVDFVRNLTIILYSIHLLFSYTVTLYPLQQALENSLLRMPCNALFPRVEALMGDYVLSHLEMVIRLVCRTVLVLLTVCMGYSLSPSTLDVFVYMVIPVSFVALILPSVFYLKLCNEEAGCLDKLANLAVLLTAVWCMGCTLTVFL